MNSRFISLHCLLILAVFHTRIALAQSTIQITPTNDIENLVLEEFIKQDSCIEVFNIQAIGELESIGSFSNGSDAINIDKGLVFTTGNLQDIGQKNSGTGTTGALYGRANAPYLRQAVGTPNIHDVVGIEFDFIPTNRLVGFNYVFASEEYCEFVGSEFNDAFGFFVSGPGIEGNGFDNSINIAKIPESDEIVSINNVNHLNNSNYFVNNLNAADADACEIIYAPQSPNVIEFDGFTRRLQAFLEVIPCETYHIRLVVGDVSDEILDSAVFLEGKSFESTGIANVRANVVGREDYTVYENCLAGEFVFSKSRLAGRGQAVGLKYTIQGTATMGVDYEIIPDSIFIAQNRFNEVIPITIIPDTIEEDREYIEIIIETITCDCISRDTAILYIEDTKEDIGVAFEEILVCSGQEFTFGPSVATAVSPLNYRWSTGDSTETVTDQITMPQSYQVTVSDFCGAKDSALIEVQIQDIPSLVVEGNFDWCEGRKPKELLLDLPGQAPWSINYSIDNTTPILIENINTNPFPLSLNQAGNYQFIGFKDEYCTGRIEGAVFVEALLFDLNVERFSPSCTAANDGKIELDIIGGVAPFVIDWSIENESETILSDLLAGDYGVVITDDLGCMIRDSIQVADAPTNARCRLDVNGSLYIPSAFSPNEDRANDEFTVYPKYGVIKQLSFQIYDRWGNLAFQSDAIEQGGKTVFWDGGDWQTGVYLCIVEMELSNGSIEYVGRDIVLLR
ncbi:MAG: choice-of-anchor L domain-containing protein [Bacteroidota bacterium]